MSDADTSQNKSFTTVKAEANSPRMLLQKKPDGGVRALFYLTDICRVDDFLQMTNMLDTATEKDDVVIVLNSPGGDVFTGIAVVTSMCNSKAEITTIAAGDCASCAAFIWSFGDKLLMGKGARLMYHQSSHVAFDKSIAVYRGAEDILNYLKFLYSKIIARGLITEAEYAKMMTEQSDINLFYDAVAPRLAALDQKSQA